MKKNKVHCNHHKDEMVVKDVVDDGGGEKKEH